MAESALRALVPRPQEIVAPTRSWNPLNPAFRDTLSSAMTNMLGASNVAGREGYDRSRYADMLTGAVDFVPGAGEAAGVGDVRREVQQGNYLGAALAGVATALGAIPVIGDVAGKAVRGGAPSAIRSVSQVVEDAVKSIPGLKLDVYGTPERGYTISRIEVPKDLRNTGLGTSVIRSITQAADQEGARLMLSPTSDFGGNKNRLEKFYRRLGFTSNSGRAKDFTTMETMIRPPSVASGIAGNALDMSQAARMQRADEMGLNKSVFHGTHAEDITEIDPNEVDIGLHVGTPEQATNRLKDLSNLFSGSGRYSGAYRQGANILPLRVQASNPLKMSDVGDWKDSYQVLVGLRGNKAFAREASRIEDMLQEANEIAEQYANGDELWRDSMENRALLDEIRSMIQGKGYDSVKYLNQVENTYGSEGALTQAADAIIRDRLSAHDYLEAQIRKRMPIPPDPSDPDYRQKIDNYLNARLENYASPDELQTMANLRNEISSIRNSPSSKNDPYSYIVLDPANIRSVNAAFDPSKRNSANLMAGVGGAAVGLSALNQLVPRNEERRPD